MGGGGVAVIYLVAYDITSDRRRNRVAKILQSWGYRIQESVFQLRVSVADIGVVRRQVTDVIDDREDVVHIYPLCAHCEERAEVHGVGVALDDVGFCRGLW